LPPIAIAFDCLQPIYLRERSRKIFLPLLFSVNLSGFSVEIIVYYPFHSSTYFAALAAGKTILVILDFVFVVSLFGFQGALVGVSSHMVGLGGRNLRANAYIM
jgi:hypothetical protein